MASSISAAVTMTKGDGSRTFHYLDGISTMCFRCSERLFSTGTTVLPTDDRRSRSKLVK